MPCFFILFLFFADADCNHGVPPAGRERAKMGGVGGEEEEAGARGIVKEEVDEIEEEGEDREKEGIEEREKTKKEEEAKPAVCVKSRS